MKKAEEEKKEKAEATETEAAETEAAETEAAETETKKETWRERLDRLHPPIRGGYRSFRSEG